MEWSALLDSVVCWFSYMGCIHLSAVFVRVVSADSGGLASQICLWLQNQQLLKLCVIMHK